MKLSDQVLSRIVQIVQEGILTGTDVVDLLRQIDVEVDQQNVDELVLTQNYCELVKKQHEKLLADAERLKAEQAASKLIVKDFGKN